MKKKVTNFGGAFTRYLIRQVLKIFQINLKISTLSFCQISLRHFDLIKSFRIISKKTLWKHWGIVKFKMANFRGAPTGSLTCYILEVLQIYSAKLLLCLCEISLRYFVLFKIQKIISKKTLKKHCGIVNSNMIIFGGITTCSLTSQELEIFQIN